VTGQQLLKLLPPALASVAGVITLYIKNLPLQIPEDLRGAYSGLLLLTVWLTYLFSLWFGPTALFHLFWTMILPLLAGTLIIGGVVYAAVRAGKPATGTAVIAYALGVAGISAGLSGYAMSSHRAVVHVPPTARAVVQTISGVNVPLPIRRFLDETGVLLDRTDKEPPDELTIATSNNSCDIPIAGRQPDTTRGAAAVYDLTKECASDTKP
jgi:hypothetical protein